MRVYNSLAAQWAERRSRAKGRIKISRFDDLNDPFELLAAQLRSKDVRKAFGALRDHMCANRGVLCFSRGWHNPLLWSHYGDKHRGICLGSMCPMRISSMFHTTRTAFWQQLRSCSAADLMPRHVQVRTAPVGIHILGSGLESAASGA